MLTNNGIIPNPDKAGGGDIRHGLPATRGAEPAGHGLAVSSLRIAVDTELWALRHSQNSKGFNISIQLQANKSVARDWTEDDNFVPDRGHDKRTETGRNSTEKLLPLG